MCPTHSLRRPCVKAACSMPDKSQLARGWILKGDSDFATARLVLQGDGPFDTACFHAQQAAEKYLKGCWHTASGPFPLPTI